MNGTRLQRMQPIRSWLRRLIDRRVPEAVGIYGVVCLLVLEVMRALWHDSPRSESWLGGLGIALLCGLPLVIALAFRRRD